jgi:hypothetical protein
MAYNFLRGDRDQPFLITLRDGRPRPLPDDDEPDIPARSLKDGR